VVALKDGSVVMEGLSGLDESKGAIPHRLAAVLEQHTFHNYGPSIRPVMELFP
jgi:hypothetical protein